MHNHDCIHVIGAREKNLRDVRVSIPKNGLRCLPACPVRASRARVRYDRGRITAAAERNLLQLRSQPAAPLRAARGGEHHQFAGIDCDQSEAARRQRQIDRRHGHGHLCAAAFAVFPAGRAFRRLFRLFPSTIRRGCAPNAKGWAKRKRF